MKVPDVQTFVELANKGKLGNTLRFYQKQRPHTWPFPLTRKYHDQGSLDLYKDSRLPESFIYQELPPHERLLQGHLYHNGTDILSLDYDESQRSLREAREDFHHVDNYLALHKLRNIMNERDLDMMLEVYYTYNQPTIEFTLWSKPCGILHRKLAFWEVRNY